MPLQKSHPNIPIPLESGKGEFRPLRSNPHLSLSPTLLRIFQPTPMIYSWKPDARYPLTMMSVVLKIAR